MRRSSLTCVCLNLVLHIYIQYGAFLSTRLVIFGSFLSTQIFLWCCVILFCCCQIVYSIYSCKLMSNLGALKCKCQNEFVGIKYVCQSYICVPLSYLERLNLNMKLFLVLSNQLFNLYLVYRCLIL